MNRPPVTTGSLVEAMRRRPAMYVGSPDRHGLMHLFEYALTTVLDAMAPTQVASAVVRVHRADGRTTVSTNVVVPGAPIVDLLATDVEVRVGDWPLLTVHALSASFSFDVQTEAGWWSFRSERGTRVDGPPLSAHAGPGTVISFAPDPGIFTNVNGVNGAWLQRRFHELAMLWPGTQFELRDDDGLVLSLRWPRGFGDWLALQDAAVERSVETQWQSVRVRAAYGLTRSPAVTAWAFANRVRVPRGDHLDALRAVVERRHPRAHRQGGWCGVISVDLPVTELRFEGPTREVLAVPGLADGVRNALEEAMK